MDTAPSPGQVVHVRTRKYLVERVHEKDALGEETVVELACLDDDAQGDTLTVLWEKEVDRQLLGRSTWESIGRKGFDRVDLFGAYLNTLQWNCVTSTDQGLFQAPYRAGIEIHEYQLEPLRMALAMPRVNLFIADDVGLGKTIEAGLIVRELLQRQRAQKIVVACPPSVVYQWRDEMEQRFGLVFAVYDRAYIARMRRQRGFGVNPFSTHTRFIISHNLLRNPAYSEPLRDWLGAGVSKGQRKAAGSVEPGSLLILDEAHHAAPSSGSRYAVDSKFTRAVRGISERFEHRLFLSATPHNGHSNSFSALLEMLDPQRFTRGIPVQPHQLNKVLVRRLKSDLRTIGRDFPERVVKPVLFDDLPADAPELTLPRLLQRYRELRRARVGSTPGRARAAGFIIVSLQKRLLSSIHAFAHTLEVHTRNLNKRSSAEISAQAARMLTESVGADDDEAELSEEEAIAAEDAQVERVTAASNAGTPGDEELALLEQMGAIAAEARALPDRRVKHLVAWIRAHQCPDLGADGAQWTDTRVIIFTEYAHTKSWLIDHLRQAIRGSDDYTNRIEAFSGGMSDENREHLKQRFNGKDSPLRILVATDAAREGINLQKQCANLFHFDLPWNPSRMEQRNGRIDRKLQPAPVVTCHYFLFTQRAEDRVLQALVDKTITIQKELGILSPVIEERMVKALEGGVDHAEADTLQARLGGDLSEAEAALEETRRREFDDATRRRMEELKSQMAALRKQLEKSRRWLHYSPKAFRGAVEASLEMLGDYELQREDEGYALPELPPEWEVTLDSLRRPREKRQKLWSWRRESPVRAVRFGEPADGSITLTDDVVQLHLEHRLAQRLLSRFRAQGFVADDGLRRACVVPTDRAVPTVVAIARLSLYGERAARLHDELIWVAADWEPLAIRDQPLESLDDAGLVEIQRDTRQGLASGRPASITEAQRAELQQTAPIDAIELEPLLKAKCVQVDEAATQALQWRGDSEANAMREVIKTQLRLLGRRLDGEGAQLSLPVREAQQLKADQQHWEHRRAALQSERKTEPARIRNSYTVKVSRVEPVGLVYLWPRTS